MRRDEPNRHGRAADAFIASYVRELLVEDQTDAPQSLPGGPGERPSAALAPPADAVAPPLEAAL